MVEANNDFRRSKSEGHQIIELLCQADSMLRAKLRMQCDNDSSLDIRFLLEAQVNTSRAIEALYDWVS